MASSCNLLETNQTHCLFAHILVKCSTAIRKLWAAKTKFSGVYYSDTNTFRKFEANSYSIPKKVWKSFSNWPSFLITSNRKSLLLHIDLKKHRFPVFAITEHLLWSWLLPNNWFYSNSVQLLFPKYCLSSLKWVDKISK